MPDQGHDLWLGMAALAAADLLPAEDAQTFAVHLSTCRRCTAELAELRAMTRALSEVAMSQDTADEAPPPTLRERVVWSVRSSRRTDMRRRVMVNTVAAAAAAIALVAIGVAIPGPAGPPQESVDLALNADSIQAEATLVAHTWGTEVKFVINGLENGERYDVTFINRQGQRVPAGTLIGVSNRPIVCDMNAAVLRPDAVRLEVASADDGVVMRAQLPPQ